MHMFIGLFFLLEELPDFVFFSDYHGLKISKLFDVQNVLLSDIQFNILFSGCINSLLVCRVI